MVVSEYGSIGRNSRMYTVAWLSVCLNQQTDRQAEITGCHEYGSIWLLVMSKRIKREAYTRNLDVHICGAVKEYGS